MVILSGPPLKNSWRAIWSASGFFWLLRNKRGAGECRLLSCLHFSPVASGAVAVRLCALPVVPQRWVRTVLAVAKTVEIIHVQWVGD